MQIKIAMYHHAINITDSNSPNDKTSYTFTLPRAMTLTFTSLFLKGNPNNSITFDQMEQSTVVLNKIENGTTTLLQQWQLNSSQRNDWDNNLSTGNTVLGNVTIPYDANAQYQLIVNLPDALGPQNSASTSGSVSCSFNYYNIPAVETQASYGGGVRVASVLNYDINGTLINNKSYKYINADGSSSELLMSPLQFVYDREMFFYDLYHQDCSIDLTTQQPDNTGSCPVDATYTGDIWWISSDSQVPLSNAAGGNIVGYSRVEEADLSNNVSTNGKTVSYYDNKVSETGYATPDNPNLQNGLITKDQIYDNLGNELREHDYSYINNWDPGTISTMMAYKNTCNAVLNTQCGDVTLGPVPYPPFTYLILMYPINSQWWLPLNKTTTEFLGGNTLTSTENYSYNKIGQLISQNTTDSKNETLTTNYFYPFDIPSTSSKYAMAEQLIGQNLYDSPLELQTLNNGIETSQTQISYNTINGQLVRSEIDKSYNGNPLYTDWTFDAYGANKSLQQASEKGVQPSAFFYDQNNSYVIAEVKNAVLSDIAYSSFELNQTGNWKMSSTAGVNSNSGLSGSCSYSLSSSNTLSKSGLSASQVYIVSYWTNGTAPLTIPGTITNYPVKGITLNGWTYYEHLVTGQASVTLAGNTTIDEVRLYPQYAQMNTYTYNPLIGISSMVDVKNQINYYEYDGFQRLINIKDQYGNIVKHMSYHYQGQ